MEENIFIKTDTAAPVRSHEGSLLGKAMEDPFIGSLLTTYGQLPVARAIAALVHGKGVQTTVPGKNLSKRL